MLNQIKQNISSNEVILLLKTLGSHRYIDNYDHIIFQTICHGGNSMKLYYYKQNKTFICYTSCNEPFDIFSLVSKVLKLNLADSIKYVKTTLGLTGDIFIPKGFGIDQLENNFEEEDLEPEIIDNLNILNNFMDYYCCEWLNEGLSVESMKKYSIKYYIHQHKIIIPHFNHSGELIGIRGRALLQQDIDNGKKYMPIYLGNKIYSHSLRHNLYGLYINKKAISDIKKCIIFESEKSVIKMDTIYGEYNISVAVGGSNISKHHINTLVSLGVEEIIIAFDRQYKVLNDEECLLWMKKIQKVIEKYSDRVTITVIWDTENLLGYKDSPIDLGKDIFEKLYNNRIIF